MMTMCMYYISMCLCIASTLGCVKDYQGCCMCPPGEMMETGGTCQAPQCVHCGLHGYMDTYNRMTRCLNQPYCNPDTNLVYWQNDTTSHIRYHMYSCSQCYPIQDIHDQDMRRLYVSNSHTKLPLCYSLGVFMSHCMPCTSTEDDVKIICHSNTRPMYVNGKFKWSTNYTPTSILYSPREQLQCVCKPGFRCSDEDCVVCVSQYESTISYAQPNESHIPKNSEERTLITWVISSVCVAVTLLLGLMLVYYRRLVRDLIVYIMHRSQVTSSTVRDYTSQHVIPLPPESPLLQLMTYGKISKSSSDPSPESTLSCFDIDDHTVASTLEGLKFTKTTDIERRDNPEAVDRVTVSRCILVLVKILVACLTSVGVIVGILYGVDRLLLSYCDSIISVYTFPLGYTVMSKGLGHSEAVALSSFLDRCRKQNEFTVPGHVKFHKAIECLKGNRQYKRVSSGALSRKESNGTEDTYSGQFGVSGSFSGITASADVMFSKTDAVERAVGRSVTTSEKVSVLSSSYQCQVGIAMVSSYEPSPLLHEGIQKLNVNPEGYVEEFLATWGYGFVSKVEVGGYYGSFEVFSTCNTEAEESLDDLAEHCRETGVKFEVTGFGAGASAGGSTARCHTQGLSDSQLKVLASISKESQHIQIGGDDLGEDIDWEKTLKMNPYPLRIHITPIFKVLGISPHAAELLKLRNTKVRLYPEEFLVEQVPSVMPPAC